MGKPEWSEAARRAVDSLNALGPEGSEKAHIKADDILLDLLKEIGLGEVADAWEAAFERIDFWYC